VHSLPSITLYNSGKVVVLPNYKKLSLNQDRSNQDYSSAKRLFDSVKPAQESQWVGSNKDGYLLIVELQSCSARTAYSQASNPFTRRLFGDAKIGCSCGDVHPAPTR
jgi:hypothetical protein